MHPENNPNNKLEAALREYGEKAAFSPLFANRIQNHINAAIRAQAVSPFDALARELAWMFRRTVLVGVSVAAVLVWYNVATSGDISVSGIFGLPDESHTSPLESVFLMD